MLGIGPRLPVGMARLPGSFILDSLFLILLRTSP